MLYHRVLILYKQGYHAAKLLGEEISQWLAQRGVDGILASADSRNYAEAPNLIVALGGDGTLLGIARHYVGKKIPIFGVNFGRVGFLCGTDKADWQKNLARTLDGEFRHHSFLALRWKLERGGNIVKEGVAANDVVISRNSLARLIAVKISINGHELGLLRGDGLICSTSLGSSGYNLSAGGPLLMPGMNSICLTPVCPFLSSVAPIVAGGDTVFEIAIGTSPADSCVTIDGQEGERLLPNDRLAITGWPNAIEFVIVPSQFLDRLKIRGFSLETTYF